MSKYEVISAIRIHGKRFPEGAEVELDEELGAELEELGRVVPAGASGKAPAKQGAKQGSKPGAKPATNDKQDGGEA